MNGQIQSNLHNVGDWGFAHPNPKDCFTCIYSLGQPPFEDNPRKAYCRVYTRESGVQKPDGVYYDGKPCKYHDNGDN